jgi:hypothetical protein
MQIAVTALCRRKSCHKMNGSINIYISNQVPITKNLFTLNHVARGSGTHVRASADFCFHFRRIVQLMLCFHFRQLLLL